MFKFAFGLVTGIVAGVVGSVFTAVLFAIIIEDSPETRQMLIDIAQD